jgi:hypothetical protein
MKGVQTLPGAVTDPDHNLLVAKICTTLKKVIRFQRTNQDGMCRSYPKTESARYSRRKTPCN